MKQAQVTANGVPFAFLEQGEGPRVLLLHGYPDNAWSWEHQLPVLAAAGYRVVAPFLRGYPPTEIPPRGCYDLATLATDISCLIDTLNDGKPCLLVGQDWGAAVTCSSCPGRRRRAVPRAQLRLHRRTVEALVARLR